MPIVKRFGKTFKVILLGDSKVGKSTLLYKYKTGNAPEGNLSETVGMDYVPKVLDVGDDSIQLSIWDPSGQEKLRVAVVPLLYRNTHAVVFVYDVTKPITLENLKLWLEECEKHHVNLKDIPVILLANKCDLKPVIEEAVGKKFAEDHGMMFFKTSVFDTEGVSELEDVFLNLAHILKFSKKPALPECYDDEIVTPNKEDLAKDNTNCCKRLLQSIFWFIPLKFWQ